MTALIILCACLPVWLGATCYFLGMTPVWRPTPSRVLIASLISACFTALLAGFFGLIAVIINLSLGVAL